MSVTCSGKPVNSLVLLLFLWLHAALVSGVPTYPDGELHHSKWGKIVSRTVGFVAGAVNTPFPGVKRPDPFTFLVIGANTGSNSNDPLWTAMHHKREKTFQVFVEPIPFIFKELQANMKANDMHQSTCVNAVISTNGQNLTLYCTGMKEDGSIAVEAGFNEWAKQTCSVSKQQLYDSKFSSREMIDKYMREYNVKGLSVQQLVDTYATNAPVKIVQIDVEGLDDEVSVKIFLTPTFYQSFCLDCTGITS